VQLSKESGQSFQIAGETISRVYNCTVTESQRQKIWNYNQKSTLPSLSVIKGASLLGKLLINNEFHIVSEKRGEIL